MHSLKEHWDKIYSSKKESEVSWYQAYPKTSIELVELFNLPPTSNIIDIGGGNSHFVDALLQKGYQNIWVLDISAIAIERAKKGLGKKGSAVHWIVSDITEFDPSIEFDLWHDRATFHFLTTEERINKYVCIATKAIRKNGYLILGTFSTRGPEMCSGLRVKRYSEISMSQKFEIGFEKIKCINEEHLTPFNTIQNFLFCGFRKR